MKIGYCDGLDVNNNVVSFLKRNVGHSPNKVAFYSNLEKQGCEAVTYKDFNKQVEQVAAGFLKRGIKTKDRVVVFVPISVNLYVVIAGLQSICAIPVFLDSWASKDYIYFVIKN